MSFSLARMRPHHWPIGTPLAQTGRSFGLGSSRHFPNVFKSSKTILLKDKCRQTCGSQKQQNPIKAANLKAPPLSHSETDTALLGLIPPPSSKLRNRNPPSVLLVRPQIPQSRWLVRVRWGGASEWLMQSSQAGGECQMRRWAGIGEEYFSSFGNTIQSETLYVSGSLCSFWRAVW